MSIAGSQNKPSYEQNLFKPILGSEIWEVGGGMFLGELIFRGAYYMNSTVLHYCILFT